MHVATTLWSEVISPGTFCSFASLCAIGTKIQIVLSQDSLNRLTFHPARVDDSAHNHKQLLWAL
jgi:hypothetical protein